MFLPRSTIHIIKINIKQYRVVLDLIKRDFKLRYLGSVFGGYWNFIHPLAMITIFTVIFSQVMKARLGGAKLGSDNAFTYTIYLCAGLLPWNAFQEMVTRGTRAFIENANLIKKVAFPTEILQTVVTGSATITFLISYGLYLLISLAVGHGIALPMITLPLIFGTQVILAIGCSMFFSILNVFFRDVEQGVTILFNLWFWLTPIVYVENLLPEKFKTILYLNPLYYFIHLYHEIAFEQTWPNWLMLLGIFIFSLFFFFLGANFMCKFKGDVPDEI